MTQIMKYTVSVFYNERFLNFIVCVVFCLDTCAQCACLVPMEAKKGHRISWNWSYRQV